MYRETARLIMYGQLGEDSILLRLSDIFERAAYEKDATKEELVRAVY